MDEGLELEVREQRRELKSGEVGHDHMEQGS